MTVPSSEPARHGFPPVVLVGFMGAGKSTVGRLVAQRLGVPFADSDDAVLERTGRTPRQIFASDGEAAFRAVERAAVADLVGRGEGVVALGGGALQDPGTRAVVARARVVYLDVSFPYVVARVGGDPGRPVLARPDVQDLHAQRAATYRSVAHVTVSTDGRTAEEVAGEVVAALAGAATG